MSKLAITGIVAVTLALLAAYRAWVISPYPMGSGDTAKSPDGRYEASAADMNNKTFWGGYQCYYEFQIKDLKTGGIIRRVAMPPPDEQFIGYRDQSAITWATNSASVTIAVGRKLDLTITIP